MGVPLYLVPSLNCHCFDASKTPVLNPAATNPTTPVTFNKAGLLTGGFGYISTAFASTNQLAQPRNGVIVMRFSFYVRSHYSDSSRLVWVS